MFRPSAGGSATAAQPRSSQRPPRDLGSRWPTRRGEAVAAEPPSCGSGQRAKVQRMSAYAVLNRRNSQLPRTPVRPSSRSAQRKPRSEVRVSIAKNTNEKARGHSFDARIGAGIGRASCDESVNECPLKMHNRTFIAPRAARAAVDVPYRRLSAFSGLILLFGRRFRHGGAAAFGSRTPGIGRGRVHAQFHSERKCPVDISAERGLFEHGPSPCRFRGPRAFDDASRRSRRGETAVRRPRTTTLAGGETAVRRLPSPFPFRPPARLPHRCADHVVCGTKRRRPCDNANSI